MTIYQEDPFQRIVNVGWGSSWAVLAWQSFWQGVLDDPNNPFVAIDGKPIFLYANPPSVIEGNVVYVDGIAPYKLVATEDHKAPNFTVTNYTCTVHDQRGDTTGIGFGFKVDHTEGTDGTDYWTHPLLAGFYHSIAEVVSAAGWNDGYTDLVLVGSHTTIGATTTIYTVEHNALIFIRLTPFKRDGFLSLPISFNTGLTPFPDEVITTYYKWQARLATFRSASKSSFTSVNDVPVSDWFVGKSASLLQLGDASINQLLPADVHFEIDLATFAVTGALNFVG